MSALESRVVAVADLSPSEVEALYELFAECFVAEREVFLRDLAGKDWCILLEDPAGGLQGFTTLALYDTVAGGRPVSVVYSGDTLVRPAHWGTMELPRSWINAVLALSAGRTQPLYWLLLTSGYRTYRFLPVFFREFYPRHDQPTPPEFRALLGELARARFGADFHGSEGAAGIVRFAAGATPLRAGIGEVSAERLKDPHIAFCLAQNPGHARGDELVCLTRVHPDNLTAAGRRMLRPGTGRQG